MQMSLFTKNGYSRASSATYLHWMTALALGCSVHSQGAAAKDLKSLVEFVAPAYTAMNFAMVCAQDDPKFHRATSGPRGTAFHYAEHVKDEAIESLTHDEAVRVLTLAADEARVIARRELRKLAPNYPRARPGEIASWCREVASEFVRAFIELHDSAHEMLIQQIEKAKQ